MLIELVSYVVTALAIYGVWLNNRKLKSCFYFWLITNSVTAAIHVYSGLYGLAIRDIVFFILAIEGLKKWSK